MLKPRREWYVVFECQATGFRTTDIRKLFRAQDGVAGWGTGK